MTPIAQLNSSPDTVKAASTGRGRSDDSSA